jgi:hypothetical protein
MTKTLSRRLERLEEQMMPTGEPTAIQIDVSIRLATGGTDQNLKFLRTPRRMTVGQGRVEDDNGN